MPGTFPIDVKKPVDVQDTSDPTALLNEHERQKALVRGRVAAERYRQQRRVAQDVLPEDGIWKGWPIP
jgi:hypothetical protein